ncbi:hypothetical protein [Salinirarus marinus]|uniref:hypothetical protein n=1 Tax=Salinirarus marinus TaxID=3068310 RepID=UPI003C6C9F42
MELSRRDLVGLCAGLGVGAAGCLSRGSNVRYPKTSGGSDARALVDSGSTAANEAPAQVDEPPSHRRLATELERIDGEIAWFARQYDDAVEAYRDALARAIATIERVRRDAEINANTIENVAAAAEDAHSVAETALGSHFDVEALVEEEASHHLDTIRKFSGRGDLDRVDEELARLATFYRSIRNQLFIKRSLSDRQIDNRLYRWLHDSDGDGFGDEDDDEDDEDEVAPGLFELYHGSTGYRAYAYNGPRYVERDPFPDATLAPVRDRFEAVGESDGREEYVYLLSYAVPPADDQPETLDPTAYRSTSLFLQRFTDAAASGRAIANLTEGPVAQEGTYSFGRDAWRRIYYTYEGDVVYAFLIRAGRYLLVAAPSRVAWEERVDWSRPLDRTWLWRR